MALNFLAQGGKRVTDVTKFLKENAAGNSVKYTAAKGIKHRIYVPYSSSEFVNPDTGATETLNEVLAYSFKIHEWNTADGKYKAFICTEGLQPTYAENSNHMVLSGSCPFCKRVGDAWEIYNYRKQAEQTKLITQGLAGDNLETAMKSATATFQTELKIRQPKTYLYLLVVQFETREMNGMQEPVIGADGLPVFSLKVMKMSESRLSKIEEQVANSGAVLPGSELVFSYPNVDDIRRVVADCSVALQYQNGFMQRYADKGLLEKINSEVEKFDWSQLDKAFLELKMLPDAEGEKIMEESFQNWDNYKKELAVNPNAKYLEYPSSIAPTTPEIGVASPQFGGIPNIQMPGIQMPNNMQMGGMQMPGVQMPGMTQGMNQGMMNNQTGMGVQGAGFGGNQLESGTVNQGVQFGQQNMGNPQGGNNTDGNVADPNSVFNGFTPQL